jgi:hypothetical protein
MCFRSIPQSSSLNHDNKSSVLKKWSARGREGAKERYMSNFPTYLTWRSTIQVRSKRRRHHSHGHGPRNATAIYVSKNWRRRPTARPKPPPPSLPFESNIPLARTASADTHHSIDLQGHGVSANEMHRSQKGQKYISRHFENSRETPISRNGIIMSIIYL